jgi:capsular polysaccharide biosynthesis protein
MSGHFLPRNGRIAGAVPVISTSNRYLRWVTDYSAVGTRLLGPTGRRPWGLLTGIAVALVVLAGGSVFWLLNPTQYRATSTLLVFPDAAAGEFAGYYDTLSRGQVTLTFAQILELQVSGASGDPVIDVQAVPDTSLITVTVTAQTAAEAESDADAVLERSRRYFTQLSSPYEISVVRAAAGTAQRSGVPVVPLVLVLPIVALIAGFAAQQAVRVLATQRRPQPVVPSAGSTTEGVSPRNGHVPLTDVPAKLRRP